MKLSKPFRFKEGFWQVLEVQKVRRRFKIRELKGFNLDLHFYFLM